MRTWRPKSIAVAAVITRPPASARTCIPDLFAPCGSGLPLAYAR
ncbi:hypothetical protein [Streptomyces sp. NPDC097981]